MAGYKFCGAAAVSRCGFLTILIITLSTLSTMVCAEEINYAGNGKSLQASPKWFDTENETGLFPGTTAAPLSSGNSVIVNYSPAARGIKAPGFVLGGLSALEDAAGNKVVLIDGQVEDSIFGGHTYEGFATHNTVSIRGGAVSGDVYGGVSDNRSMNNSVVVNGGFVNGFVYSGYSIDGASAGNKVTVSGGSIGGGLYGGYTHEGGSAGNAVTISGGSVGSFVSGGWSLDGNVADNVVAVSGGSVDGDVYGGSSYHGKTTGNQVTINGGIVGKSVAGGVSSEGAITGNSVTINGGSVGAAVYGGQSLVGDTVSNTVTVSGGTVGGNIYGGFCTLGDATGNIVTVSGSPTLTTSYVLGGYVYEADVYNKDKDYFTGNTLNVKSSGISAKGVGNFEYYNFDLPQNLTAGAVMLSVEETVSLKGTTVEISLQGGAKLSKGDKITLIHSAAGASGAPKNKSCRVKHDGLLYEFSIHTDFYNLWAEVTKISNTVK